MPTPDVNMLASLLSKTFLFGGLGEEVLRVLAGRVTLATHERGEVIFRQDEPGDRLFVVMEGVVRLVVRLHDGTVELERLYPHDVFGELELLDRGPRRATAEALVPTTLAAVDRNSLMEVVLLNPEVIDAFLHTLGRHVRQISNQLVGRSLLDVRARVAKQLLIMGTMGLGLKGTDIRPTQSEIAEMVGGTRQTVNQVLRRFEDQGWIRMAGRRLEVLAWDELRRVAGG